MLPLFSINWFIFKRLIGINKHVNLYKKRFTCCHEIWHYVKGHLHDAPWVPHWKSQNEKEADQYAMNALMPKKQLLEELEYYEGDLSMLEKVFGVESSVIEKRLSQFGIKRDNQGF